MVNGGKIDRKFKRHLLDVTPTGNSRTWCVLGKDLEELNTEMNANVDKKENILGEVNVAITNYEAESSVEPYYARLGDPLFEYLQNIVDNRLTHDDLKTHLLDVHLWDETSTTGVYNAIMEDVYIEIVSDGGDTSGYQIPFNIHHTGIRSAGTYNTSTSAFTPAS